MLCTWREVHAAFDDFRLRGEKAMVIVGAGPVGLSFARFASLLGFGYVGLVDRHAGKRRKAETLGASEVFASLAELENLPARLGGPLDAVIDAVGSEEAINAALPLIKSAGSICVYDAPVAGVAGQRASGAAKLGRQTGSTKDGRIGSQTRGAHDRQPSRGGCGDRVSHDRRGARPSYALPAGRRDRAAQALDQLNRRPVQSPSRPGDRPERAGIPVHPVGWQGGL